MEYKLLHLHVDMGDFSYVPVVNSILQPAEISTEHKY